MSAPQHTVDASGFARVYSPEGSDNPVLHYALNGFKAFLHTEMGGARFDSGSLIQSAENALQVMLSKDINFKKPPLLEMINMGGSGAMPGAESYSFREFDGAGGFKPMAPGANDMPFGDASGQRVSGFITPFHLGISFNWYELLAAAMAGTSIEDKKRRAVERAWAELVEKVYLIGDDAGNLKGLINNKRALRVKLSKNGASNGAALKLTGSSAGTATEIRDGIYAFLNRVANESNEALDSEGSALILPGPAYRKLCDTTRDATNQSSLKEEIERDKGVKLVKSRRLQDVDGSKVGLTSGTNYQFIGLVPDDPDLVEMIEAAPHRWFAAQQNGTGTIIPSAGALGEPAIYQKNCAAFAHYTE